MTARPTALALRLLVACSGALAAQTAPDSAKASLFKVDLTIPAAPAFALLQVDESKAIQPGTVRDLALAFSGFSSPDNRFQIPASFAVEAAPLLLIARALTVRDYQRQAWLSRARVSVASRRADDAGGLTRLAVGVRTSLFDHTDPRDRSNDAFRNAAYAFIDPLVCIDVAVWLESQGLDPKRASKSPLDVAELNKIKDADERRKKSAELDSVRTASSCTPPAGAGAQARRRSTPGSPAAKAQDVAAVKAALLNSLDSLQRDFEERHWNALKVEVAAALGGVSRDSTGRDPVVERQEAWVGTMIPFGPLEGARTWGSNVGIGITGVLSRARDTVTQRLETGFVVAARLAGGGNALRGFGEGQFTSSGARGWLANLGAELRVVEGAWLQFTAGYASPQPGDETTSRHWITGFQVRGAPAIGGFFGLE